LSCEPESGFHNASDRIERVFGVRHDVTRKAW
jgi:hypothetical protein